MTSRILKGPSWTLFVVAVLVASAVAFGVGLLLTASRDPGGTSRDVDESAHYCSMHPHIRKGGPGKCDICGMNLILLQESSDPGPRALEVSESAMALADIETARVERRDVSRRIRMVGKVAFDETRVKTITSWVSGRLDRLYVDYDGVPVKKGEHLVDIYSPELLSAQQELLEARRAVGKLSDSDSSLVFDSSLRTLDAVKEKLRRLGLSDDQVREIEQRGTASDHILINAPVGGVIIRKFASEGEYVKTGKPLYKIADLSQLWVELDAYESDLSWLRYGQEVEFSTQAYPGQIFRGSIHFLDWVVEEGTRTVSVRVNVDNSDRRLKPGMFVRAEVQAALGEGGLVMSPELSGKWISPMHPEIVKEGPGQCDVCGMDLVPAESLFRTDSEARGPPLVVPKGAVLMTGRRAVVYVRLSDRTSPTFEGREVVLGPRAGDFYVVLEGLMEGEEVVVRGNFKIDSALQILAKPSMMNPGGGESRGGRAHQQGQQATNHGDGDRQVSSAGEETERLKTDANFQRSFTPVLNLYFEMGAALAGDDAETARRLARSVTEAVEAVEAAGLYDAARDEWRKVSVGLLEATRPPEGKGIDALRQSFRFLSGLLIRADRRLGHSDGRTHYEAFCPMAFDGEGDSWLQLDKDILNPYFGAAMLRCGTIRSELPPFKPDEGDEGQEDPAAEEQK